MPENCPIEISPLAESKKIKTSKIINLNYTNQDFWSMKSRIIDFINQRFGPDGTVLPNTFNDLVEGSIAIMIIESLAFLADTQSFKLDQIVNELFIDTVTEPENAFRLSKLIGFNPQPPIAARSSWVAQINNTLITDVSIPTPVTISIVADDQPITIELFAMDSNDNPIFDDDIVIPAGSAVNQTIIGLEGKTFTEEFSGTGNVSQSIQLPSSPVIYDSIRVEVDGVLWEQVDYFTDSQPRKEYRVEFNSEYIGFVIFGNNSAGLIPSQGSRIRITYRVGGGVRGNIVTGFVETQRQVFVPGLEFSIPVSFRNYTKGEFGYDGDTIEDIRRKLPAWIRTQNRAVTGLDYKTLADQFSTAYYGQVGKATAVLRNHGCAGNVIDLYILAKDNNDNLSIASNGLKVALNDEITQKKMLTHFVCIKNGSIILADITVDITLDKSLRKFESEFRVNILNKINNFFSLYAWEYGKTLRDSDLIKEISDIKEIETTEITFTTNDEDNSGSTVTAKYYEIIRPDTITLSFIYN